MSRPSTCTSGAGADEMPLDVASASVARLLADRHALLAGVYDGIATGLARI